MNNKNTKHSAPRPLGRGWGEGLLLLLLLMFCSMTTAWAQDTTLPKDGDGYYVVETLQQLKDAVKNDLSDDGVKSYSKIRLAKDILLDGMNNTLNNTFCGILEGNGHSISGGVVNRIKCSYLFTNAEDAQFRNLTFRNIRVESSDRDNQAVIVQDAKDNCRFENITFDNISIWCNYNSIGAVAGHAKLCSFTNIKVKNSDFTVDDNSASAVVGTAERCTLAAIEVNHCEVTADDDNAGGVVGSSDNCVFLDMSIKDSYLTVNGLNAGGVAGYSTYSLYTNCKVDDQTIVYANGRFSKAYAGGIVGHAESGTFRNCINSALVIGEGGYAGGVVGKLSVKIATDGINEISNCLNTGLICLRVSSSVSDMIAMYRNKAFPHETKYYLGKEYTIMHCEEKQTHILSYENLGGIGGNVANTDVSRCANIGALYGGSKHVGGVVGAMEHGGTISDCLSDCTFNNCERVSSFSDNSDYYVKMGLAMYNCLSAIDVCNPGNQVYDVDNNYTICEDLFCGTWGTVVKKSDLSSGSLVGRLGENWEQNIGTAPYPTPTGSRGAYHTRMVSNEYGTVCLPFSVKSDDKISYYRFTEVMEGEDVTLKFSSTDETIPAGTPVLYRAADVAGATEPVMICFNHYGDGFTSTTNAPVGGRWEMGGTFVEKVFEGDVAKGIYYISGGVIKNTDKPAFAPYSAWIYGPDINDLNGKSILLMIDGDVPTALQLVGDDLVPVQKNGKTYTLMGTEVGKGYKGIVIRNGRKVVRK